MKHEKFNSLLSKYTYINFYDEKMKEKNFFSDEINALPAEIALMILDIEKTYRISFDEKFLLNINNMTYNKIYNYIEKN